MQMLWFGEITAHYIRFWYRNDVYLGRRISQEIIFERNFWNSNRACYIEIFPEKYLIVFRSDAKSAPINDWAAYYMAYILGICEFDD